MFVKCILMVFAWGICLVACGSSPIISPNPDDILEEPINTNEGPVTSDKQDTLLGWVGEYQGTGLMTRSSITVDSLDRSKVISSSLDTLENNSSIKLNITSGGVAVHFEKSERRASVGGGPPPSVSMHEFGVTGYMSMSSSESCKLNRVVVGTDTTITGKLTFGSHPDLGTTFSTTTILVAVTR